MIIVIGEILVDRFPDYERIGGAPFNFAFHLKKLGLPVRFLSRVGDDPQGREIRDMLQRNGFGAEDVQIDKDHPTGTVNVTLDNQGVPQFDIVREVAYDFLDLSSLQAADATDWRMIYFGTLAQRTRRGFDGIRTFLSKARPSTDCFCDINLRPPHVRDEAVLSSLNQATILKLNDDELGRIGNLCGWPESDREPEALLMRTYGIDMLAITHGSRGSTLISGGRTYHGAPVDVDGMMDTVGAGDAYAAILAAGYLNGISLPKTIDLATGFAATICTLPGAVPKDDHIYQNLREQLERSAHDR
jgi:fructokinase